MVVVHRRGMHHNAYLIGQELMKRAEVVWPANPPASVASDARKRSKSGIAAEKALVRIEKLYEDAREKAHVIAGAVSSPVHGNDDEAQALELGDIDKQQFDTAKWETWALDEPDIFFSQCKNGEFTHSEKRLFVALMILCIVVSDDLGQRTRLLFIRTCQQTGLPEDRWIEVKRLAANFRAGATWGAQDIFRILDMDSKDIPAFTICERASWVCTRCCGRVLNTFCC